MNLEINFITVLSWHTVIIIWS